MNIPKLRARTQEEKISKTSWLVWRSVVFLETTKLPTVRPWQEDEDSQKKNCEAEFT